MIYNGKPYDKKIIINACKTITSQGALKNFNLKNCKFTIIPSELNNSVIFRCLWDNNTHANDEIPFSKIEQFILNKKLKKINGI